MEQDNKHITIVTDANFEQEVVDSKLPVVVDCWAIWCGPCRVLSPLIDELGQEYAGKIKVCKLDVDHNPETTRAFGILSIPTVLYFRDGKEVDRTVGAIPKPALKPHFEKLLDHAQA